MSPYVLITPARNEEAFIDVTIQCVVGQTVRPAEWVIVSDGSTDRTEEIVRAAAQKHPWIRLLVLPQRPNHSFAAVVNATESGVRALTTKDYEYIGLLDSDVRFQSDYFENVLECFESSPRLGLAGGVVIDVGSTNTSLPRNRQDVPGAAQFFRRSCFEALGGLLAIPEGGWDALTCARARMVGYETRLFTHLVVDHLKPRNASEGRFPRRQWQMGVRDHALGYHPLFEAFKCLDRTREFPFLVGAIAWWVGYCWSSIRCRECLVPKDLLAFVRAEQVGRLKQLARFRKAPALTPALSPMERENPRPSRLSIVVVNWRSKDYLRRCLQTIKRTCADINPQIIVVDGASLDGCGEMLATAFPHVEFVQSQENLGYGRLNNLGFEYADCDALLILNPDTELLPGAVTTLLAELQRRPDAGILGPKLLNSDGSLQSSCVQSLPSPLNQALDSEFLRGLLPRSRLWGVGQAFRAVDPVPVEALSGACMLLPADVFRKVGGFSREFFMYGEDMDLCAKVRRAGLNVYHVPAASVVHHGGGSSSPQDSTFAIVMQRVALETYMRRNRGAMAAFWYRVLQAFSALARLVILLPARVLLGQRRRTAAAISLKKWACVLRWAAGFCDAASTRSTAKQVPRLAVPESCPPAAGGRPALP